MENPRPFLRGQKEIQDYIGVSGPTLTKLIKRGLPCRLIDGQWYAHKENIDLFFKSITKTKSKKIPSEISD